MNFLHCNNKTSKNHIEIAKQQEHACMNQMEGLTTREKTIGESSNLKMDLGTGFATGTTKPRSNVGA